AVQFTLPSLLADALPVEVSATLEPGAILLGLAIGGWVALVFALRPILALRSVSPLQALRRTVDPAVLRRGWNDWQRVTVDALIVLTMVGISWERIGNAREGLAIAGAIGAA